MTRLDVFIRAMILQSFSLSQLELSPKQVNYLEKMIKETYERQELLSYSIEERVAYMIQRDRDYFLTLV